MLLALLVCCLQLSVFAQNVSSILYENWDNPGWLPTEKEDYLYDANNYLTQWEYREWDAGASAWLLIGKADYTNNANGAPTQFIAMGWDSNTSTWVNSAKGTYTYNAAGKMLTFTNHDWDNGTWKVTYIETNTYDNNGYLITTLEESFDLAGALIYKNRTTFTNNAGGVVQQAIGENWNLNTSTWITGGRTTYTYNANSKVSLETFDIWQSNAWVPANKINYFYDASNYLIQNIMTYYQPANGQWINQQQLNYVNLTNGKIYQITYLYWNSNTNIWENSYRETNTYNSVGVSEPLRLNVQISPNPTADYLRINLENQMPFTASIVNIEGKTVLSAQKFNSHSPIDVRTLPSGVYMLQLQQNGRAMNTKFVKE